MSPARPAAVFLAALLALVASVAGAQPGNGYPHGGTKAAQWQYIVQAARRGFEAKGTEGGLTGQQKRAAFSRRTRSFADAATAVRFYLDQRFTDEASRRSAAFAYATFTGGIYWENAADPWQARTWYRRASILTTRLAPSGAAVPLYRGTSIATLLPARIERTARLAQLSGGVHPSSFEFEILFGHSEHEAATNYLLNHSDQVPDLFGIADAASAVEDVDEGQEP